MGFMQAAPVSGRTFRRAAAALASTAGISMVFGAGVAMATPGYVNTNFANGGNFVHQFGLGTTPASQGAGVTVAPNGDIYEVGSASSSTYDMYIARFLPDGTLDQSFGNGGVTYENVAGSTGATAVPSGGPFNAGAYVALTPSGEPVVLTDTTIPSSGGVQLAVLEFTQSGELDQSFANQGVYQVNIGADGTLPGGIAVTSNGKIVFTGTAVSASATNQFVAGELTSTGAVDAGFGHNGLLEPTIGSNETLGSGVIVLSNGDLAFDALALGSSTEQIAVLRADSAGNLDPSFGSSGDGIAYVPDATPIPFTPGFAVTPDGGYAITGAEMTGGTSSSPEPQANVTELTVSGELDTSFGTGGTAVLTALPLSFADGLFVQADGKLILTGVAAESLSGGSGPGPFVARLNSDGSPDSSFGAGGASLNPVGAGPSYSFPLAAAETPDGNVVVSGITQGSSLTSEAFLQEDNLDIAPTLAIAASTTVAQAGTPVTFVATASGYSGETVSQPSWDFGSGSFGDAAGATVTKTFTQPGSYTVRAEVTDGYGLSAIATQTVTVTPAPVKTTAVPTTTSPGNVTPAQAIAPTLKLVKLTASHGKVKVTLLCAFAACSVTAHLSTHEHTTKGKGASLSANGRGRSVTVGAANLRLGVNQIRTFTIKLNKAGRKLLAKFERVPAAASFRLTNTKPAKTITHKVTVH